MPRMGVHARKLLDRFGGPWITEVPLPRRRRLALAALAVVTIAVMCVFAWNTLVLKRFAVVESGRIYRGAWPSPWPLRRLVDRERIKTVITLTAINRDDPKYVAQEAALRGTGVDWIIIPMRGSRATLEQMRDVADLMADPARQPVFFHCVGGHHRSNLVHAAYRIRHQGWSFEEAWGEVAALAWSRPDRDVEDRLRIQAFAQRQAQDGGSPHVTLAHSVGTSGLPAHRPHQHRISADSVGIGELRNR